MASDKLTRGVYYVDSTGQAHDIATYNYGDLEYSVYLEVNKVLVEAKKKIDLDLWPKVCHELVDRKWRKPSRDFESLLLIHYGEGKADDTLKKCLCDIHFPAFLHIAFRVARKDLSDKVLGKLSEYYSKIEKRIPKPIYEKALVILATKS
jgi:hypothetical protein